MLTLPATVTVEQATEVLRSISPAANGGAEMTVDASALNDFDSSALAVLLECRRRAQAAGRPFRVDGAPLKLVELARLYGVDAALPGLEASPQAVGR